MHRIDDGSSSYILGDTVHGKELPVGFIHSLEARK
jgi:hypothetical protein